LTIFLYYDDFIVALSHIFASMLDTSLLNRASYV